MVGVLWARHLRGEPLRALDLAVRFSVVAAVSLVAAGMAGVTMAFLIVDDWANVLFSPWGRLLAVKVVLVAMAGGLGAVNHFRLIPALERAPDDDGRSERLRRVVTIEAGVVVLVMALTALLVGAGTS